jgi:hypothetical protein
MSPSKLLDNTRSYRRTISVGASAPTARWNAKLLPSLGRLNVVDSVSGQNARYRINEITARHWRTLATKSGIPNLWHCMQSLPATASPAIDQIEARLRAQFPEREYTTIRAGIRTRARRFARTAAPEFEPGGVPQPMLPTHPEAFEVVERLMVVVE